MSIWWWFVWSIPLVISVIALLAGLTSPNHGDFLIFGLPLLVVTIAAAVKKVKVGYLIKNKVLRVFGHIGALIMVVLFIYVAVKLSQEMEGERQDMRKARQEVMTSFGQGFFE